MDKAQNPIQRSDIQWMKALGNPVSTVDVALCGYHHLRNWIIPHRVLRTHVLYYVIRGGFRGKVGGGDIRIGCGLYWIPPGVAHNLFQDPECELLVLHNFRFRLISGVVDVSFAGARPLFSPDSARLRPLMEQVYDDCRRSHPEVNRRLLSLIYLMYSDVAHARPMDSAEPGHRLDEAARRKLRGYVAGRIRERPTPADLADELRLSPDYFARLFRRTFGMAPKVWLVRERIEQAAVRMVDTPQLNVSEIAREFGYEDVFLFSRQFRAVMGRSPRQFRRERGEGLKPGR